MSEPGVSFAEKAQFELLCLANHVEAINGLLYMTGGGWTEHHRPPLQPNGQVTISHVGIAVMVRIPWNETNRPHKFQVEIQDLDGTSLMKVEGDLNVGRPAQQAPRSMHAWRSSVTLRSPAPEATCFEAF